jgi:hypothetical protein
MVLLERRIGHLPAHKLAADGARFRALGAQAVGLPAKTRGGANLPAQENRRAGSLFSCPVGLDEGRVEGAERHLVRPVDNGVVLTWQGQHEYMIKLAAI